MVSFTPLGYCTSTVEWGLLTHRWKMLFLGQFIDISLVVEHMRQVVVEPASAAACSAG
jgi:hypothetical protein